MISLPRRCAIAAISLSLAAVMFHGQIASALITRGDDAIRNGDTAGAVRYYRRALAVDGSSTRAADRLAFYLTMRRAAGDAEAAIGVATAALERTPHDPALLADRGLAEQRLHRWAAAETDLGNAGQAGQDPRYDHLAGRVALRRGDLAGARRYFRIALALDPAFGPARVALQGLP
jgi:tetratricopeptide (TPR) repeat protein